MSEPRPNNRLAEAFKEGMNLIGLSTAAAISVATLNPFPLLVGLVAEAAYLLFVPDSSWYSQRLSRKYDAEVQARRDQLKREVLPQLRSEVKERFERLERTRGEIAQQPLQKERWFRDVLRKLDYLLEKYLEFAQREAQFRQYLASLLREVRGDDPRVTQPDPGDWSNDRRRVKGQPRRPLIRDQEAADAESAYVHLSPADRWVKQTAEEIKRAYSQDMESLRLAMSHEEDLSTTQAVLEKRMEVLQRRQEFVDKIARILTNVGHQLALLEDTFGLINDEIRARSPEQVLADINDVVGQTNIMTEALEEMNRFESLLQRFSG